MLKRKVGIVVAVVAWCACLMGSAFAGEYAITDLGVFSGFTSSKAFGINDLGQVVGDVINGGAYAAYVWDSTHGMQLLSDAANAVAVGINNNGLIIGNFNSNQAVLWQGGVRTALGTLGGAASTAFGLNNNNQVVGWSDLAYNPNLGGSAYHGFLYENNQMKDLGTLTNYPLYDSGYSLAYGINNNGQIAGVATSDNGYWTNHAFVREADGTMKDLGGYPGDSFSEGQAVAVNDKGQVAGHAYSAAGNSVPLVWASDAAAANVVAMPTGFDNGQFYAMNAQGKVVGVMWNTAHAADSSFDRAFVYDAVNGARDLNSLIDPALGWDLKFARSINAKGQIVGYGLLNGQGRAYLLTPAVAPEPISCTLFGLGVVALGLRQLRKKQKRGGSIINNY